MTGWLEKIRTGRASSANQAKERLKFVLIHDRTDLTPQELESLKNELIHVISRYIEIDPSAVQIMINQDGREQRLVADIPIRKDARRRKIG
jgi:cell division topological specificity factor